MDPCAVTSRSGSNLLTIADIAANYRLTSAERMVLIARIAGEWDVNCKGSTEWHRAKRVTMTRHYDTQAVTIARRNLQN